MDTQIANWTDQVDAVDQETIEEQGPSYPFIQWVNGKAELKAAGGVLWTGGWFTKGDQFSEELPAGWTEGSLPHRDGGETEGFFTQTLTFAFLRMRQCWRVKDVSGRDRQFPYREYEQAQAMGTPRGKTQLLVVVKGLEQIGPVVLTVKGTTAAALVGRKGDSIFRQFDLHVRQVANRIVRKAGKKSQFPWLAFWMTVGPALDGKGQPIFVKVGDGDASSRVTLPALIGVHEKMNPDEIGKLLVGNDNITIFSTYWKEAESWAHAWDQSQVPDEIVENDNHNKLTDIEEDEIPF